MTGAFSRWKAECVAGALLAGIGAFFLLQSLRLPPPEEAGIPGPGTAPMLLGGAIALIGLALVVGAVLGRDGETLPPLERRQVLALAGLVLGALLFEPAGFMLASFLLLAGGFVFLGDAPPSRAIPAGALGAGLLWLLFTKLLGVGLPYGVIAEILFR